MNKQIYRLGAAKLTNRWFIACCLTMISCKPALPGKERKNSNYNPLTNVAPDARSLPCPSLQQTGDTKVILDCHVDITNTSPPSYILVVGLTNLDNHNWSFERDWPIWKFPVWVLDNGAEVPLTQFGKSHEPRPNARHNPDAYDTSSSPIYFEPGKRKDFQVDLTPLFEFQDDRTYTIIVETKLDDVPNPPKTQNNCGLDKLLCTLSDIKGSLKSLMILSLAIIGSPGNLIPGLFDDEPLDAGDLIVRFGWWG